MALKPAWQKADIIGKIALGVAGLLLSAALAWAEAGDRSREAERKDREVAHKDEEAVRLKEESYTNEFRAYYSMARDPRANTELSKSDLDIAGTIAQTLANAPFRKPFYSDAVVALRASLIPDGLPEQSERSAELQAAEASSNSAVARNTDEWFAVIGSYDISDGGRRLAVARATEASATLGCVEVWRTRLSRSLAVVAGGKTSRSTALATAQRVRRQRLAPDAFTQANRQWDREFRVGCERTG